MFLKDPCSPTFCGGDRCCNPTANCRGVNHKAECSCPTGTEGEPRTGGVCRAVQNKGSSGLTTGNRGTNGGCRTCGSGGGTGRFEEAECYKLSDCAFDRQCQGIPGRCVDPCTNNVETGKAVTRVW